MNAHVNESTYAHMYVYHMLSAKLENIHSKTSTIHSNGCKIINYASMPNTSIYVHIYIYIYTYNAQKT